jgi:3-oxoacyl-[acyl-carrier protein] reductase
MNRFENKIAVVTGGCRGIGKSIVEKLASEGARVFALDYTLPDEAQGFSGNPELDKLIKLVQADVTSEESVRIAFEKVIAEGGRIDVLVNNAGITRDTLIMRMSVEQWDSVINTNLKGAFLCTKAAIRPMMSQKSGAIINVGSIVGTIGNAGQANYSSSKAGLIGFTKSLAKELGGRNITVNCISPGFVLTPMTDKLTEEQKNQYLENIPLKRAALPADIANVIAFFASDEASYVTGQVLHVDGGLAM